MLKTLEEDAIAVARHNMVENNIRPGGVRHKGVCRVMHKLPREHFVSAQQRGIAYADCTCAINVHETTRHILSPLSLARLVELATPTAHDIVLDVAAGSGYGSAVLAGLCDTVISLEEDAKLVARMAENFATLGIDNAVAVQGALTQGQTRQAPFDIILINGCVASVPETLLAQLAENGRLVCAEYKEGVSKAMIYRRVPNGNYDGFSNCVAFDITAPELACFRPPTGFVF